MLRKLRTANSFSLMAPSDAFPHLLRRSERGARSLPWSPSSAAFRPREEADDAQRTTRGTTQPCLDYRDWARSCQGVCGARRRRRSFPHPVDSRRTFLTVRAARPRPMSRWTLAFMVSISTSGGIGICSVVGLRVKIAQLLDTPAYAVRGRADPNRLGAASRTAVTCTATGTAAGRRRPWRGAWRARFR